MSISDISSQFPEELLHFRIEAPQVVRGGIRITLDLVKYPPKCTQPSDTEKEIIAKWANWWRMTNWAMNPATQNPKWRSPCRSGQIWLHFGEAAELTTGHPYVFCLNCGLTLQHPRNIRTKHLQNYLKTQNCITTQTAIHSQPVILSSPIS